MSEDLRTTKDDGVLTVTITRPQRMNAFGIAAARELAGIIAAADADPAVRVVVITGEGKAFCTGADLAGEPAAPEEALEAVNSYVRAIVGASIPVLAKVNGPCAGMAVGLALAADLVFAAEDAYFLLPFVGIGLLPDAGTTALVPAAIGRTRAMGMALLGERLYAPEALRAGMLTSVRPAAELDGAVAAAAARLASGPREAIAATKRAVNASTLAGLDDALRRETESQVILLETDDHREGVDAMLSKRPANFAL
ncbi:enoyl-CoA hydratase-related protein [Tsukamurella sp. PLM1]|uniref:enoyl-CoA hydratase-related protein n=1 Tax=Tsukamurella sp. PLM1 TaxID=2929795 RepID=UPI00205249C9|nr:enoyl-CoA hydratase-related protein [Tsukamurella sp. PLM1]BDH59798.1 enoyl-CoA hydratase [Tsukamurella sp. PLM1]